MEELPKIVRSRLAHQLSANQAHPDTNLLAAFAEQTLLEREREAISAHLAQCAECRESLALATAAQPVAESAPAAPRRHWFLEWRWAGAAAAACCVIAVALQYRVQPPAAEAPAYLVVRPQAVAPLPENQAVQPTRQTAPKLKVEALNKTLQLRPPAQLAQQPSPPLVMPQLYASAPERSPAPVLTTQVEPPAPAEQAKTLLPSAIEPNAPRPEPPKGALAQKDIAAFQAQNEIRPQANAFAQGTVVRGRVASARSMTTGSAPTVLWSINASPASAGKAHGVVERSLDSGQTWEAAPLNGDVSFRTVVSTGQHVWAGGTNGALFHSADGGAHWDRVAVSDDSARLTGTIVNIDARDANLIRITTSSGEKWISADGGRAWKRQ
jgi:photosynthesis system II assembly factor YCF48-like protein/putative zinc finger protein